MVLISRRNYGCRIQEIHISGMRALVLENKTLRVTVLLDKGADIIEFLHKPTDTDWMGISPMGLRNPREFQVSIPGRNGHLIDSYEGGWQDIFPNGGDACTVQGVEYGQHGEAALLVWDYEVIVDSPNLITVELETRTLRTPFRLIKRLTLRQEQSVLEIQESITNEGAEPLPIMWGQHPAIGSPALNEYCRVTLPPCQVHSLQEMSVSSRQMLGPGTLWPLTPDSGDNLSNVLPEKAGKERLYFLTDIEEGWYGIYDTSRTTGFGLSWSLREYPYLWYWHNSGTKGSPWFGKAYLFALEPFSSPIPQLSRAFELGWANEIQPGQTIATWVTAVATFGQTINGVTQNGTILELDANESPT